MAGDLGGGAGISGATPPPQFFPPPKAPWDLALQGNGASSPCGLHERGGAAEWEEESGPQPGR